MKSLLLIFTLFTFALSAQKSPFFEPNFNKNFDPYSKDGNHHACVTQFTYFDVNYVNNYVRHFLKNYMEMRCDEENEKENDSYMKGENVFIFYTWKKGVQVGNQVGKSMKIVYKCIEHPKYLVVESVEITGFFDYLYEFYIKYWPTKIAYGSAITNENSVTYYGQDKAVFSFIKTSPKITIVNNTIKSVADFRKHNL